VSVAKDILHELRLRLPEADCRHKKTVRKIRKKTAEEEATAR